MRRNTIEFLKPSLSTRPEALDTVDMTLCISKFIVRVQHPEMLRVADINQSIIAAPTVRMNHGLKRNVAPNHLLQCRFTTIRHDLGIDRAVAFEDTEDDGLATGSAPSFASNSASTEVTFIHFDFTGKGRGTFTFFRDALTDSDKEHSHAAARQASQFGCFAGRQIVRKVADDLARFTFINFGTSVITV